MATSAILAWTLVNECPVPDDVDSLLVVQIRTVRRTVVGPRCRNARQTGWISMVDRKSDVRWAVSEELVGHDRSCHSGDHDRDCESHTAGEVPERRHSTRCENQHAEDPEHRDGGGREADRPCE